MTSQEHATIMLLDHQASRETRMRLAGIRENDLSAYYRAERLKGVDVLTATERMSAHARFLDGRYEEDLEVLRNLMERTS